MNEEIPWSRCCKVKSLDNEWKFSHSASNVLIHWLKIRSLNKDFTLQHRDQGISSFIQWFFIESVEGRKYLYECKPVNSCYHNWQYIPEDKNSSPACTPHTSPLNSNPEKKTSIKGKPWGLEMHFHIPFLFAFIHIIWGWFIRPLP